MKLKCFIKNIEKVVLWLGSNSAGRLPGSTRHFYQGEQMDTLYARDASVLSH